MKTNPNSAQVSVAASIVLLAAERINDIDASDIVLRLEEEKVREEWQLEYIDSHQWHMLGAPMGLVSSIRRCLIERKHETQQTQSHPQSPLQPNRRALHKASNAVSRLLLEENASEDSLSPKQCDGEALDVADVRHLSPKKPTRLPSQGATTFLSSMTTTSSLQAEEYVGSLQINENNFHVQNKDIPFEPVIPTFGEAFVKNEGDDSAPPPITIVGAATMQPRRISSLAIDVTQSIIDEDRQFESVAGATLPTSSTGRSVMPGQHQHQHPHPHGSGQCTPPTMPIRMPSVPVELKASSLTLLESGTVFTDDEDEDDSEYEQDLSGGKKVSTSRNAPPMMPMRMASVPADIQNGNGGSSLTERDKDDSSKRSSVVSLEGLSIQEVDDEDDD